MRWRQTNHASHKDLVGKEVVVVVVLLLNGQWIYWLCESLEQQDPRIYCQVIRKEGRKEGKEEKRAKKVKRETILQIMLIHYTPTTTIDSDSDIDDESYFTNTNL